MRIPFLVSLVRRYDWTLLAAVFVLVAIGLSAIYSVDLSRGEQLIFFPTQIVAVLIGAALLALGARMHMNFYQSSARLVYIVAVLFLIGVLLFGTTIRGTTGWFRFAGVSFQPAEFAKVALVLILAFIIHGQGRRFDRVEFLVRTGLPTAVFVGLILLQPDLGSALVFLAIWFGLLLLTGVLLFAVGLLSDQIAQLRKERLQG